MTSHRCAVTSLEVLVIRGIAISLLCTVATVVYTFVYDQSLISDSPTETVTTLTNSHPNTSSQLQFREMNLSSNYAPTFIRKQLLVDHCPKARKKSLILNVQFNMFVNDELKIMYCTVGKTASSAWRKFILVASGVIKVDDIDSLRFASVRNIGLRHYRSIKHHKNEKIFHYLSNYFKFLFVRHPFDRIVSAYRDKFRIQPEYFNKFGRQIIERYRTNATNASLSNGSDVTFTEFVRYLVDTNVKERDIHWHMQERLCRPCVINYDFIGHYETLWSDASEVLRILGVPSNLKFPRWQNNKTAADSYKTMFAQVPTEYVERLKQLYAQDFKLFGYEL